MKVHRRLMRLAERVCHTLDAVPRIALTVVAISAAGLAVAGVALALTPGAPIEKSYERVANQTEAELIAEAAQLAGDAPYRVPVVLPSPDLGITEADLVRHGGFRIVVPEFAGTLTYQDSGHADGGVSSADPAVVEASPLYVDIGAMLPAGLTRLIVDTFDGGLNTAVRQVYVCEKALAGGTSPAAGRTEGPGAPKRHCPKNATARPTTGELRALPSQEIKPPAVAFEFDRVVKGVTPIDVFSPLEDGRSALDMVLTYVVGYEAVVFTPSEFGKGEGYDTVQVLWLQDGVQNAVTAHGMPAEVVLDLVRKIATAADGGA